jgi:hypothetical protein
MTFDEAFREIGVPPGSSQEEIRRAYLRLVKVRKPETDPEGFRRLREAFDLLREQPEPSPSPEILFRPRPAAERPAGRKAQQNPADLIEAAEAWFFEGETARAVEAVLAALEEAEARGGLPDPLPVILLILRLQGQGESAGAARVLERLQGALRSSGKELSRLDDQAAALWQVAQEIPGLSEDFPASTRAAISGAVAADVPERAIPQLLEAVEMDREIGWRMAAEIKDLPGLGSLYHDAILESLEKPRLRRRPAQQSWRPAQVGGMLLGIWLLAQWARSCSPSFGTPPPSTRDSYPWIPKSSAMAPSEPLGDHATVDHDAS